MGCGEGCAKCTCCGYPNGIIQVITMQFLLFCGFCLSFAALLDCKFVATASTPEDIQDDDLATVLPYGRGLGYYMFENNKGNCAWSDVRDWDQWKTYYFDFLGRDWKTGRAFGVLAAALGVVMWIWSLVLVCMSHSRPCRYVMVLFLLILVVFQGLTFLPLNSGFCKNVDCTFSRSAGLSVGALLCYFVCGVLVCFMTDYDVSPDKKDEKDVVVTAAKEAPSQEEEEDTEDKEEDVMEQDQVSDEEDDAFNDEEAQNKDNKGADEEAQESSANQEDTPNDSEVQAGGGETEFDHQLATNESIELTA